MEHGLSFAKHFNMGRIQHAAHADRLVVAGKYLCIPTRIPFLYHDIGLVHVQIIEDTFHCRPHYRIASLLLLYAIGIHSRFIAMVALYHGNDLCSAIALLFVEFIEKTVAEILVAVCHICVFTLYQRTHLSIRSKFLSFIRVHHCLCGSDDGFEKNGSFQKNTLADRRFFPRCAALRCSCLLYLRGGSISRPPQFHCRRAFILPVQLSPSRCIEQFTGTSFFH